MLWSVTGGAVCYVTLQSITLTCLPLIGEYYSAPPQHAAWALTAFLVTAAMAAPVAGKLGDVRGYGRTMTALLAITTAGCVVSALAPSLEIFSVGRAMQGVSGGVVPLGYGVIRQHVNGPAAARAVSGLTMAFGAGGLIGILMPGPLADALGLPAVLGVCAAMTACGMVAVRRWVPTVEAHVPRRIDWRGAMILCTALCATLLGLSNVPTLGWASPTVLALLACGAVALVVWGAVEVRTIEPLVDLRLLARRPVALTNLSTGLIGVGLFGQMVVVPALLRAPVATGYGFDASTTAIGLVYLPSTVAQILVTPVVGIMILRIGARLVLAAGAALFGISFLLLAEFHGSWAEVVLGTTLNGPGVQMALAASAALVIESVPAHDVGVATGINVIARAAVGALGAQVVATILAAGSGGEGSIIPEGSFVAALVLLAGAQAVAGAVAIAVPRRPAFATAAPSRASG
jgi:MFS family permease